MTDDGYRGYNIENGEVVEYYDHRSEFVPNPVVVEPRPKGCCSGCIGCMEGCQKSPAASIVAFVFIFCGSLMWVICGVMGIDQSTHLFEEYGPDTGNPATDPPPEWIKGPGLYDDWRLIDPDKPGNYYPMVTERLKYCMYAIAPLTIITALIMLCDGYKSVQEFQAMKRGCKSSSAGICCSVFLIGIAWWAILGWCLFVGFNGLGIYYYRMVAERCHDRYERNFGSGVYPEICIDLVQLGVVMFKNTQAQSYGLICGEGRANPDAYGNLELYCQHYKTPYALFICSLVGAGLIMIGFMQFSMSLSANYSLLQKKFSRPMAKYRENAKKAHAHAASEKQNLIPPSYAPSVPGVHAPSQKFDNSYNLPPNPGYGSDAYTSVNGDLPMQSRGAPMVRSDASVDNYYKRPYHVTRPTRNPWTSLRPSVPGPNTLMKGNCVKMCSTILHHDIEEIKYHLSEIVSLKEIEIMEARRKAAEREEQEQAKQVAQEEQIKNRHLILKLSKQIRYFAKRGKLGNLTNFLAKFQGRFQGLINNKSSKGCTALHWAAARGHEEVINQLINSGADPTITTDYGQKPADLSRIRSLRVKLLEEAEKWEQRDEIPNCRKNQFHPISVKQQNPSDVEIASNEFIKLPGLYDEMHDYIFSLKKLKNDKINELITKYCNLQTCLQ